MKITVSTVFWSLFWLSLIMVAYVFTSLVVTGIVAVCAVVMVSALLIGVRGQNFFDRWKKRREFNHRKRRQTFLLTLHSGAGASVDEEKFSLYIELTAEPYSVMRSDGTFSTLPLDTIAEAFMIEGDFKPWHINVISHALRVSDSSPYSSVYSAGVPYDHYCSLHTVLEVTLSLASNARDVYMRALNDDPRSEKGMARGMEHALEIAAQHVVRYLLRQGWHAHVMTTTEVASFHNQVLSCYNQAFRGEKWLGMVGDKGPSARAVLVPKGKDIIPPMDIYTRCVTVSHTLTPYASGGVGVDTAVAVAHDTDVPTISGGQLLGGIQGDLITRMLPLASTVSTVRDPEVYTVASDIECAFPLQPLGVFMGHAVELVDQKITRGDTQVFIDFFSTRGDIIYTNLDRKKLWALMARLAVIGERVTLLSARTEDIMAAQRLNIELLTVSTSSQGSTVAVVPEHVRTTIRPSRLRTTVVQGTVPTSAENFVYERTGGIVTLSTQGKATSLYWGFIDGEESLLQQAGL